MEATLGNCNLDAQRKSCGQFHVIPTNLTESCISQSHPTVSPSYLLNQLDVLLFLGTVGEHSVEQRWRPGDERSACLCLPRAWMKVWTPKDTAEHHFSTFPIT